VSAVVAVRDGSGTVPVEDHRLTRYGASKRAVGGNLVNSALTRC